MDEKHALLISAVRCFLNDEEDTLIKNADEQDLKNLYRLSFSYDLMQIVFFALEKNCVKKDEKYYPLITEGYYQAISRTENLNYDLGLICDALNEANVAFLPLKGAVMRSLYRDAFYRTSSDIDVLIKKDDLNIASKVFTKKLSFKFKGGTGHDRLFESPSGTQIELHFNLLEEGMAGKSYEVLNSVWEHSVKDSGEKYVMQDGFFYFYHVAHMAKHFENGTLGLRPFIDLYILTLKDYREKAKAFIESAGLTLFDDCANNLAKVWFADAPHNLNTEKMESFIFGGGVFGNAEVKMSVNTRRAGGKKKYILRRIFLPYNKLKNYYPNLEKHKWLLPVYQVKRWFRLLFKGKRKVAAKDLKLAKNTSSEKGNELFEFCRSLGIGR